MGNLLETEISKYWHRAVGSVFHNEDELKAYKGNLYHYTSSDGLRGILESQKIWGTEASYLNDSQEIKYGIDLAVKTLVKCSSGKRGWVTDVVHQAIDAVGRNTGEEIYLACFCEKGDLLSQWKGYSKFGEGYSLGFSASELSRFKRKYPFVNISIRKVIYGREPQERVVKSEFESIAKQTEPLIGKYRGDRDKIIKTAASCLAYCLKAQLVRFKAESFREEHEWRAIYINSERNEEGRQTVKFRVSEGHVVPYIELDIAPSAQKQVWFLPIAEIVVGPKVDVSRAKRSIDLLYKNMLRGSPIVRSSTVRLQ